ncbi:MbtH family protein [Streptomyces sp. AB3(2024)]|uniref:MbtH family protein n=1 Tax=Streptomyces sp. AB3(2024) TaxID=3317321 RepID=UPI0035A38A7B
MTRVQGDRVDEDGKTYQVVTNHEGQHSIWFMGRSIPNGWRATDFSGPKRACLDHIDEVWTDMRPLSLREQTHPVDAG